MNKAIFLDRDGTINIDKDYIYKISDFEFIPKAPEGLKLLQDAGYKLFIITNQSGIARGYYTVGDYNVLNNWMIKELKEEYDVEITASYFCPHLPETDLGAIIPNYRQNCTCRKPGTALFEKAIVDYDIDLENSYAIGDKIRDLSICERLIESAKNGKNGNKNGGCKGFLVGNKENEFTIQRVKSGEVNGISYTESLYTAAEKILSNINEKLAPQICTAYLKI